MRKNRGKKREKNISEIIIVERDSRREKRKEFKGQDDKTEIWNLDQNLIY